MLRSSDVHTSFLFVGLGNPGSSYEMTRHNIGALVIRSFAHKRGWLFKREEWFKASVARGSIGDQEVRLLFPETYMNLAGEAVKRYLDYFQLPLSRCLIIVDDVALPFGKMRLRATGSTGGHNGLKSVETLLGTSSYIRLRMGIGAPGSASLASYVLAHFNQQEMEQLEGFIERGVRVLEQSLTSSLPHLIHAVNSS